MFEVLNEAIRELSQGRLINLYISDDGTDVEYLYSMGEQWISFGRFDYENCYKVVTTKEEFIPILRGMGFKMELEYNEYCNKWIATGKRKYDS